MKSHLISNTLEFQDAIFDGVYQNLTSNISQIKEPGLPDICIIQKRFKKSLKLNPFQKSQTVEQEQQSSFHMIQGLCPQSAAEISAYFSQIIQSQESANQFKLFQNGEFEIQKLTYLCWNIFSKTLCVYQLEMSLNTSSLSSFKSFGMTMKDGKKQIVPITEEEQDGIYISSIIRAIDVDCRLPTASKVYKGEYKRFQLCNEEQIKKFLFQYFNLLKCSRVEFSLSSIKQTPYQIHWTLGVLCSYFQRTNLHQILIDTLLEIKQSFVTQLIISIFHYKSHNYLESLKFCADLILQYPQIIFPYYLQAKIFIKLGKYQNAFIILQTCLPYTVKKSLIFVLLSDVFKFQSEFYLSVIFLNKSAACYEKGDNNFKKLHAEDILHNYRILCGNKTLTHLVQMDKFFTLLEPTNIDKVESYPQIIQRPEWGHILMKSRVNDFSKNKKKYQLWLQQQLKNSCIITQEQYDNIFKFAIDRENPIEPRVIKLYQILGPSKLQNLINEIFSTRKINKELVEPQIEITLDTLDINKEYNQSGQRSQDLNKSMQLPYTTEEVLLSEENEHVPSFLKGNDPLTQEEKIIRQQSYLASLKQTKPKRVSSAKNSQSRQILKAFRGPATTKNSQKNLSIKTIIHETANESLESERQKIPYTAQLLKQISKNKISHAPSSIQITEKQLQPIEVVFQGKSIENLLRSRYEKLDPKFEKTLGDFLKLIQTFELIFQSKCHPTPQQGSRTTSPTKTNQFFKANLQQTLQNGQHISEKQIEIKDFYNLPQFQNTQETDYSLFQRLQTIFLLKCALIAETLHKYELSKCICLKLSASVISIQVMDLLIQLSQRENNPKATIKYLQRCINDFQDCGVVYITSLPIWIEEYIIKTINQCGAQTLLNILQNTDTDISFYLFKQVILKTQNLLK